MGYPEPEDLVKQARLEIEGMSCGHCVAAVRGALQGLDGVTVEEVAIGSARVGYDPATVTPARITEAVADAGYAATVTEAG